MLIGACPECGGTVEHQEAVCAIPAVLLNAVRENAMNGDNRKRALRPSWDEYFTIAKVIVARHVFEKGMAR